MRALIALALIPLLLSACARNMSQDVYSSSAPVGKVQRGTVISARNVTIKDNDKLGSGPGTLVGGVAGGVAGSTIGKGNGNTLATVGGALAGAALGAVIEDQLTTQNGIEYIVQLDSTTKSLPKSKTKQKEITLNDGTSISADIKQSIDVAETESDVISVIQSADQPIPVGARVLLVYNDDRPRIVLAR